LHATLKKFSVKLFPILAGLKTRSIDELLANLDEKLNESPNIKFHLEKMSSTLINIQRFLETIDKETNDAQTLEACQLEKNLSTCRDSLQV